MKHGLCGKTMTKFAGLKQKIYRCLTNNSDENENTKGTEMFIIKQKFRFEENKKIFRSNSTSKWNKIPRK